MHIPFTRPLVWVTMANLVLASNGCSLLDPYVRAKELDTDTDRMSLTAAMGLAEAQRKAYYDAVSDRAKLRNGLPLVLVPIGAAAMYKGFTSDGGEVTRKLLVKEGLFGASVFSVASYYTSTSREQTYLSGVKALSCSIYAMTPYLAVNELGKRLTIDEAEDFAASIANLEDGKLAVQAVMLNSLTEKSLHDQLDALLKHADLSIAAARDVQSRIATASASLDNAGAQLRAVVNNIVGEVNSQISVQEPNPAAILTMVEGLPTVAGRFAPAGNFTPPSHDKLSVGNSLKAAELQGFERDLQALDARTAKKRAVLDRMAERAKLVPSLSSCQVQTAKGQIDVSPEPPVQMKVGETLQFVIRSTAGMPLVEWSGVVDSKIGLKKTPLGETMLVEVNYNAAVTGVSEVTLLAASGAVKKQIVIGLAPAATPTKPATPATPEKAASAVGPAPAASASASAASETKTKKATTGTETKKTGPGTETKKTGAIPATEKTEQATETKKQSVPDAAASGASAASAASALPAAPPVADNKEEVKALADNGAKLKVLQQKLGVPATGIFDPATRTAIRKWKTDHGFPDADDKLQTPIVVGILKS